MRNPEYQSLTWIQMLLQRIYGTRNTKMYTTADLLLHVFEETSVIAEIMRKEDHTDIEKAMARLFGWLIAFCNMEGIDLAKAVFAKYHGACPYCGRKKNCMCISVEKKPKHWVQPKNTVMPIKCSQWQRLFTNIYGNVNRLAGREKAWLHLLEELGELSKAHRLGQKRFMREELADVFAWFIAFCNHLKLQLFDSIIKLYNNRCDVCLREECQCPKV